MSEEIRPNLSALVCRPNRYGNLPEFLFNCQSRFLKKFGDLSALVCRPNRYGNLSEFSLLLPKQISGEIRQFECVGMSAKPLRKSLRVFSFTVKADFVRNSAIFVSQTAAEISLKLVRYLKMKIGRLECFFTYLRSVLAEYRASPRLHL